MPSTSKTRTRLTSQAIVRRHAEDHPDRSLSDVEAALVQIGDRHARELAAELAALPALEGARDPEAGRSKKATQAT